MQTTSNPTPARDLPPPVAETGPSRAARSTQALLSTSPRHHGFEALEVEGELPRDLVGTLYRNGPALFEVGGVRYDHLFEGDGGITALRLDGGHAFGAHRILETPGLAQERAEGRAIFGTSVPWHRRIANTYRGRHKNVANTSVLSHQGALYALWEAGKPTRIDGDTLALVGEDTLGGVVQGAFSAHPHAVPARRTTYNFGVKLGRVNQLTAYALPWEGEARVLGEVALRHPVMLHDFVATERHLVWFVSPIKLDLARFALGLATFDRLFRWDASLATEVIVMPIDAPSEVRRFEVPAFFQWHFANAFEREGEIVVDYVRYANMDSFHEIGRTAAAKGALHRAVIDAHGLRSEETSSLACEFPLVHPAFEGTQSTATWVSLQGETGGIARIRGKEERAFFFDEGTLASEAVVIPKPGAPRSEDDVYVAALVMDGASQRSFFAVWDGPRFQDGPIAKAWFDHPVPITFHGKWVPTAT